MLISIRREVEHKLHQLLNNNRTRTWLRHRKNIVACLSLFPRMSKEMQSNNRHKLGRLNRQRMTITSTELRIGVKMIVIVTVISVSSQINLQSKYILINHHITEPVLRLKYLKLHQMSGLIREKSNRWIENLIKLQILHFLTMMMTIFEQKQS